MIDLGANWIMSKPEQSAFDNAFSLWRKNRTVPSEKEDRAFEIFGLEQVLKNYELDDAEIAEGNAGRGGGDGGVDGFFFFVDRQLVKEDTFTPSGALSAELTLVSATLSPNYKEDKLDKLEKFCQYLLEWRSLDSKKGLNSTVKDNMLRFRHVYEQLLTHTHTLSVNLHYLCRSQHEPPKNFIERAEEIESYIKKKLPVADVCFTPWGENRLLDAVRSTAKRKLVLEKKEIMMTSDGSAVCLCAVSDFAAFLDDGKGRLMTWIMEPNVRDYQGNNQVNKQIRVTLNNAQWSEDFWWLNNGITILSDSCSCTGNKVTIENPEIVNGLQTSYEVFSARNIAELKKRHVLVKVIVAPDDRSKNAIIKATNSQTQVNAISLKATDPLQFDIEDRIALLGLFYDRRKGKYRRLKKPIKSIVSITSLGQAIIACYLQRPSDSRARPESLLKNEKYSPLIFNEDHGLDFYAACLQVDRKCAEYVESEKTLKEEEKVDLRYYVTMLAASHLCAKSQPQALEIADILPHLNANLNDKLLKKCTAEALAAYQAKGATDKAAKGRDMENSLKASLQKLYRPK